MLSKPFEYKIIHYSTTLSIQSPELTLGGIEQGGGIVGLWGDICKSWFFSACMAKNYRAGTTQALTPMCLSGLHSPWQRSCGWVKQTAMDSWDRALVHLSCAIKAWSAPDQAVNPCSLLPLEHHLLIVEVKTRIKGECSHPCVLNPAGSVSCMPSSSSGNKYEAQFGWWIPAVLPFFVMAGTVCGTGGGLGNSEHQQDTRDAFNPKIGTWLRPCAVMLSSPLQLLTALCEVTWLYLIIIVLPLGSPSALVTLSATALLFFALGEDSPGRKESKPYWDLSYAAFIVISVCKQVRVQKHQLKSSSFIPKRWA